MIDNKELGKELKSFRKSKKMKQWEVADKLNISNTTYSNYERGARRPSYEKLTALASLYRTTVDNLLSNNRKI